MLTERPFHKNRYRFSLIIIDANGIKMKEQLPVMLDHNGLQKDAMEQSNTFNMQYNNADHEADE